MVRDGAIVTLYAQWQKDDSGEVTPDPPVPDGGGSSGGRSSGGGSDAPDVTDPNDNSVADWLETVNHIPYMQGYPDETFKPTNNITRAEVATVFYRLLLNKDVEKGSFSDVAEDSWYYDAVSTLAGIDVLKGYADGTFRPNAPITRAEFSAIVTRLANQVDHEFTPIFSDVVPGQWFYDAVYTTKYYGWIGGYPDGTFRPEQSINRSEVAKLVNYMLARFPDMNMIDAGHGNRFADVSEDFWAFYEIVEATTPHEYYRENVLDREIWESVR